MAVPPRVPVAFPERIPVVARGTVVVFLVVVAKIGIDLELHVFRMAICEKGVKTTVDRASIGPGATDENNRT